MAGEPFVIVRGMVMLTPEEQASIDRRLRALTISQQTGCGADASDTELLVDTAAGVFRYHASFYACHRKGIYVDGLWELEGALAEVVRARR